MSRICDMHYGQSQVGDQIILSNLGIKGLWGRGLSLSVPFENTSHLHHFLPCEFPIFSVNEKWDKKTQQKVTPPTHHPNTHAHTYMRAHIQMYCSKTIGSTVLEAGKKHTNQFKLITKLKVIN